MKTGIVIQARTGSTRLPGKVLLPLGSRTVLEWGVARMQRVHSADTVIVATTHLKEDDAIVNLCRSKNIPVTRGSDWNVLERYYAAAQEHHLDTVVRITSDCPLIAPELTDEVIRAYGAESCDVAANIVERTFPRGFDTEVLSTQLLKKIIDLKLETFYCEHVTPYFYEHCNRFKLRSITASGVLARPDIRICIDTPQDYDLLKRIFENLSDPLQATGQEIVRLFQIHPDWLQINADVVHLKHKGKN